MSLPEVSERAKEIVQKELVDDSMWAEHQLVALQQTNPILAQIIVKPIASREPFEKKMLLYTLLVPFRLLEVEMEIRNEQAKEFTVLQTADAL